ncbi:MAG: hypothetical protein IKX36_00745 [Prevotella sp.]|nr:hypothetical protein [Prevotella sp.]
MNTKVWRVFFLMMFTAVSFMSCGCGEEDDIEIGLLSGKWMQVYDKDVICEGYVYYTFIFDSDTSGKCIIEVNDAFAGNHSEERVFILSDFGRHITIFKGLYGGDNDPWDYRIKQLTSNRLTLILADHPDVVQHFEKK